MNTKNKWWIGAGIALVLIVLFALPFIWQAVFPAYGFGMGYGRMPMMAGGGFSHMRGGIGFGMGFGSFFFWLIPFGLLVLIGLGIAALVKYLNNGQAEPPKPE